jgi:hypothetical protein
MIWAAVYVHELCFRGVLLEKYYHLFQNSLHNKKFCDKPNDGHLHSNASICVMILAETIH